MKRPPTNKTVVTIKDEVTGEERTMIRTGSEENDNIRLWTPEQLKKYREYQKQFNKERYATIKVMVPKKEYDELLQYVWNQPNTREYIIGLIEEDMKNKHGRERILELQKKIRELEKENALLQKKLDKIKSI